MKRVCNCISGDTFLALIQDTPSSRQPSRDGNALPHRVKASRAGRYDGNMALVASLSDKTNYQQRLIEESMRCQLLNK